MSFPTLGTQTRTIFLNKEQHKLHLEFTANNTIKIGQPVKLHTDGTVQAYLAGDAGTTPILGYALHDATSGQLLTVATRGYAVIMCYSEIAIPSTGMCRFMSFFSSGDQNYNRVQVTGTTIANMAGWVLDTAAGVNGLVRVLVMD